MIKIINCGGAAFSVGISGGLAPRRPANGDTLNYKWRRGRCRFASFDVRKFLGGREGRFGSLARGQFDLTVRLVLNWNCAIRFAKKSSSTTLGFWRKGGGVSRSKVTSLYLYVPF